MILKSLTLLQREQDGGGRRGGGGEREEVSTFFPLNVGNSIAKILNSRRKRRKRKRMDIAVSPEKRREVEQQRG
jgi:hypothetical protein